MNDKTKNKWKKFAEEQPFTEEEADMQQDAVTAEQDSALGLEFPERQQLEDQLTAMEQQMNKYKDENLRLLAKLKNEQDRAERMISNAHKFGSEKLLFDLLPIVDSLTRGLESSDAKDPQLQSVREGMKLTLDLLYKTLEKHGVEMIQPQRGDAFDPSVHEAMGMHPDPEVEPNKILQTVQQGYLLNGRVLRAAMVVVSS